MTTKFITMEARYTNITMGYGCEWVAVAKFDTVEEAIEYGFTNVKRGMATSGNFKVVEKTMNEETFEITEKDVAKFDYFYGVVRPARAEKIKEEIAELEKKVARARTENGKAKAEKKIAELREEIEEIEEAKAKAFVRY